jgi:O6-methylguanine-DNA--protein-cysteine methyltransferase
MRRLLSQTAKVECADDLTSWRHVPTCNLTRQLLSWTRPLLTLSRHQSVTMVGRSEEVWLWYTTVFEAIQEIPHGKVTSYGHIARLVGKRERHPPCDYEIRLTDTFS